MVTLVVSVVVGTVAVGEGVRPGLDVEAGEGGEVEVKEREEEGGDGEGDVI